MATRIITAVVALAMFIPVLFFSHTIIFNVVVAFLSCMSAFELLKCMGLHKKLALSIPSLFISGFIPMLTGKITKEALFLCVIAYLFALLYASVFARRDHSTADIALAFFAAFFSTTAFSSIAITRMMPKGEYIYLLIFIGAWTTDTFAYFTGTIFGKHKLIPQISPNKTIEGSIGGTIFCVIAFIIYGFAANKLNEADITPNYLFLAVGGLVTSIIAQLGDLSFSAIKRNFGIKNFGGVFPGHGGVIDRFDSVMAVAPIIMIFTAILIKLSGVGMFI